MKIICSIYKSSKKANTFLYTPKSIGLKEVPEALLKQFGKAELAMTLLLHNDRTLANADVNKVLDALQQKGFYLQLPPDSEGLDDYMRDVSRKNSKLEQ